MTDLDEALDLLHRADRTSTRPLDAVRARVVEAAATNVVPMRRRRLVPVTVAAAAVALVVSGVVVVRATDAPSQAPPVAAPPVAAPPTVSEQQVALLSAAELLDDAANNIKTADQPVAPGRYRLITEHGTYARGILFGSSVDDPQPLKGATYAVELKYQTWIPADVTQEWLNRRTQIGDAKWLGGNISPSQAPYQRQDTDSGDRRGRCGDFFPKSQPRKVCGDPSDWDSPAFYAALPRDPAALYEWLRAHTSQRGSTPTAMFATATEILRAGLMPADVRAGWYRAIARIDGVTVSPQKVTMDGRTGVGITLADRRERIELVISPDTGEFIGDRSLTGPESDYPWLPEGTVLKSTAITTEVVDSIG
ncbi:CU044_5270 family protein [Nocardia sp. NRRL S-836]|uniref:CU044_5270 family protein n=1 Tax=Nocardia sp. NRRL S-836 TaxID=1519492 RepID=UPI000A96777D|nr:CU044_5270 family protein [Nocardia sp. NRRL S-836]